MLLLLLAVTNGLCFNKGAVGKVSIFFYIQSGPVFVNVPAYNMATFKPMVVFPALKIKMYPLTIEFYQQCFKIGPIRIVAQAVFFC